MNAATKNAESDVTGGAERWVGGSAGALFASVRRGGVWVCVAGTMLLSGRVEAHLVDVEVPVDQIGWWTTQLREYLVGSLGEAIVNAEDSFPADGRWALEVLSTEGSAGGLPCQVSVRLTGLESSEGQDLSGLLLGCPRLEPAAGAPDASAQLLTWDARLEPVAGTGRAHLLSRVQLTLDGSDLILLLNH